MRKTGENNKQKFEEKISISMDELKKQLKNMKI